MINETYLGDGLFASYDGWQITLRTRRETGDHFVALEPAVLEEFERYVAAIRAIEDVEPEQHQGDHS
jgi:hypothetical protein